MITLLKNNRIEIHPENNQEQLFLEDLFVDGEHSISYVYDNKVQLEKINIEKVEE